MSKKDEEEGSNDENNSFKHIGAIKQIRPDISVIISVYNGERYLEKTINSILTNSSLNIELIIIDDKSTDGGYEILKKLKKGDSRITILQNKENIGKAGAVNRGLEISRGKYICIFDADDLMYPGRLEKQFNFLEKNPKVDMVFSNFVFLNQNGEEIIREALGFKSTKEPLQRLKKAKESLKKIEKSYQILDKSNYIPPSSALFRRKIIEAGVKMDSKLRNNEDMDFIFQIIGKGFILKKLDLIAFKYRIHPDQKSKNPEKMKEAKEYIFNKLKKGEYV